MPRKFKHYFFIFLLDFDTGGIITVFRVMHRKRGEAQLEIENAFVEKVEDRLRSLIYIMNCFEEFWTV